MLSKSKLYLLTGGILLIIAGLILLIVPQSINKNRDYYQQVQNNLDREIGIANDVLESVSKQILESSLVQINDLDVDSNYPYFIYHNQELVFWSDHSLVPSTKEANLVEPVGYLERDGWKVLLLKSDLNIAKDPGLIKIVVMVPLVYDPGFSNKYLKTQWNDQIFSNSQFSVLAVRDQNPEGFILMKKDGNSIFALQLEDNYRLKFIEIKYFAFSLILIGFTLVFASDVSGKPNTRYVDGKGNFIWFLIVWLCLYFLFKLTNIFNLWEEVPFFDSRIYASSWILNNLFDLLLFSFLFLGISFYSARLISRWRIIKTIRSFKGIFGFLFSVFSILTLLYILTLHFLVFRDIYDNSQISLDVNHSLTINYERLTCLIIFLLNAFTVFFLFHTFLKLWFFSSRGKIYTKAGSIASGIGIFILIENKFPVLYLISILLIYMILLNQSGIYRHFMRLNYLSLLYLSGSLVLSSIIASYSITAMEQKRDANEMRRFGNEQLLDADIFGEFLMGETVEKIREDPFIGNWLSSPFVSKDIIGRKINQIYIDPYLDRYDVRIYLYNQSGKPLGPDANSIDYQIALNRVAVDENRTDFNGIYRAGDFKSDMFKKYQAFIEIRRLGSPVGFIQINFDQKRVATNDVYPELLIDSRTYQPPGNLKISYAVYSGRDLLNSVGDYNYQNAFPVDELRYEDIYSKGIKLKGNFHLALDADQRTLVLSSPSHTTSEALSNFSFFFLSLVLLVGLIFALFVLTQPENSSVRGFASKIQLYLNLAFILPLLLVSITTLSLLSTQSRKEIEDQNRQKGYDIAENIQRELDNFQYDPIENRDLLAEKLRTTSSILRTDADLYNLSGGLIVSTQPKIYEKGLTSKYIDSQARVEIVNYSVNYLLKESSIGELKYNVTYVPVKTLNTGKLVGVLGLPFFDFTSILESQQIGVLTNILNIFSLLFLTLLIISYFVSQRLVVPLKMIAEKLTKTSLTGYNPPIQWDTQDEIGLLVGEYNRMIRNLEASKEVLTRTQKELAWREIARQVAHEIKNPLTPMKLTLQQLQRRISGRTSMEPQDVEKPITTLLQQVDTLRDIATSFSAFAKMPIPEMKRFDLMEVLSKSFNLHKNIEKASVELLPGEKNVYVIGDEKLMGRIATNIILNAIQSSSGEDIHVEGNVRIVGKKTLISFKDNGPGIDKEIQDKIFLPSFSTKSEGSGIGLAIAKHGIEQSGGQIWFESEKEKGTTFFIELPLAEE